MTNDTSRDSKSDGQQSEHEDGQSDAGTSESGDGASRVGGDLLGGIPWTPRPPWANDDDVPPTLREIRDRYDITKNSWSALVVPAVGIGFYSLPALVTLAELHSPKREFHFLTVELALVPILLGILVVVAAAGRSGSQDAVDESYEDDAALRDWPRTLPLDRRTRVEDLEGGGPEMLRILLTEYETVSKEARYRDRLINRSNYYALAVLGAFGIFLNGAAPHQRPLVFMLLSLSMLVFAMALVKYKDARDPLWLRQRDLERMVPAFRGLLTTFHTIRTPKRRLLDRLSMSSFLTSVYLAITVLSILGYAYTLSEVL